MRKNSDGQVELVLENRQVLVIFFCIAALLGVFFSLGYIVGRNTFYTPAPVAEAAGDPALSGERPSSMPPPSYLSQAERPGNSLDATAAPTNLSFYESVEENDPDARLLPPESLAATPSGGIPPSPAVNLVPDPLPLRGILVQVSALSRREDADALVTLLTEKSLPVQVTSGTADSLFHVVVGPYNTEREAQQAKAVLEADGFRPILKR